MNDYFYALVDRINGYGYEYMLKELWKMPFESKVTLDDNLLVSARDIRDEMGYGKCRVNRGNCFEIFVVLATKMDDILHDLRHGDRTEEWFWLMMKNTGLILYDNENFSKEDVERIIDMFVHRNYSKNGYGGPFPLTKPRNNLRKVDYWYQLNWYVNENFEYEFKEIESEAFEDG